jgi:UDP-2,3-diacylglucosamine hydrolase
VAEAAPAMAEFVAPPAWTCIDFVSDLHLAADMPQTFEAFAAYLRSTSADAVFILGDLFDAWVGDDARHEGFEAQCTALLAAAAQRRPLAFMVGNRDFLAGAAWVQACGMTALADPTLLVACGQRLLLTHGDALCLADMEYQR